MNRQNGRGIKGLGCDFLVRNHRIVDFVRLSYFITVIREGFRLRATTTETDGRRHTRRRDRTLAEATADQTRPSCKPSRRRRRRRSAPRSARPREPRNARRRHPHASWVAGLPHRPSPARARDDARYARANAKAHANDLIFSRFDFRRAMARDVARDGWWRRFQSSMDGFAFRLRRFGWEDETRARDVFIASKHDDAREGNDEKR